ncbi:MAG: hypothetical protein WCK60_02780 [Candidatus Nomurabacteria bacterium]
MKKTPSIRQRRYAYGIMNESKTKQQIALESGFSYSTSRVPKSIENKLGFKLAVAKIAGEMENVSMQVLFELQARDMSKMDNKTLLYALEVISKTHERFSLKLV